MKKILSAIMCIVMILGIAACGGGNDDVKETQATIEQIDPVNVLTANDVYEALEFEYVPVVDGGVIVHEDNTSKAVYVSEPKGKNDSVEIKITQMTDKIDAQSVKAQYDATMAKRSDTIEVANLGESAYIAFPSIYVYDRGCVIKITAGSGNSSEQQNLLMALATKAVTNFEAIVPPLSESKN